MSQGTPAKESRIERHLMRQRGAGVRAITADFGFSFRLPAPAFEPVASVVSPTEPPSKRRRISGVVDEEDTNLQRPSVFESRGSDQPIAEGHRECLQNSPTCRSVEDKATKESSKAVKKPQKARRKLQLEDDVEVPKPTPSSKQDQKDKATIVTKPARRQAKITAAKKVDVQSVEDTFVFGLKSKKRCTQQEQREEAGEHLAPEIEDALPGKQPAGNTKQTSTESKRKAEKAAPTEKPKLASPQAVKQPKASAKKLTKATVAAAKAKVDTGPSTSQAADTSVEHESVPEKPKSPVKAKQSTKKSIKAIRSIEIGAKKPEGLTIEANDPPEKPAKTARAESRTEIHSIPEAQPDEDVDELSFDASEAPVHSLVPKKIHKAEKSKPLTGISTKATTALVTRATADSNDTEVPTTTARRPRRQAAISAKEKVAMGYEEELVPVDKLRRAPDATTTTRRSKKAIPEQVVPTEEAPAQSTNDPPATDAVSGQHEDAFSYSKKKPTKAVRKAAGRSATTKSTGQDGVKAVADVVDPTGSGASIAEIHSVVIAEPDQPITDTDKHAHESVDTKPAPKKRQALAESNINIPKASPRRDESEKPVKTMKSQIIDHGDGPKLTVKSSSRPKSAKQDSKAKHEERIDRAHENESKTLANASKRSRKLQIGPKESPSLDVDLLSDQCTASNGNKRSAADEDLDWLFDKPEANPVQPMIARKTATKVRRRLPDHNTKDLDFDDDFLGSIAGFSGKLLTGRNGRVR